MALSGLSDNESGSLFLNLSSYLYPMNTFTPYENTVSYKTTFISYKYKLCLHFGHYLLSSLISQNQTKLSVVQVLILSVHSC